MLWFSHNEMEFQTADFWIVCWIADLSDQDIDFPDSAVPDGGYWTPHPAEGMGGEICPGCEENIGKFFTWNEFDTEYQSNNCLTNCRCDLDTDK